MEGVRCRHYDVAGILNDTSERYAVLVEHVWRHDSRLVSIMQRARGVFLWL